MDSLTIEFDRERDGRWIAEVMNEPRGCLAYGTTRRQAAERALEVWWTEEHDTDALLWGDAIDAWNQGHAGKIVPLQEIINWWLRNTVMSLEASVRSMEARLETAVRRSPSGDVRGSGPLAIKQEAEHVRKALEHQMEELGMLPICRHCGDASGRPHVCMTLGDGLSTEKMQGSDP